jgi:hypothetical protein
MRESDFFYLRRFKSTALAFLVLLAWWNRRHITRLPHYLADVLCYMCRQRNERKKAPRRAA